MSVANRPIRIAQAALAACLLCACSPSLPPVTDSPTGQVQAGRFVWYDLLSEDPAAAEDFYAAVFGWSFEDSGTADYRLIRSDGVAIAGIGPADNRQSEFTESRWLATVSVADVDQAAARVREGGGEVLVEPVDVRGRGRLAVVRDPRGAVLVLLRAEGGDPPEGGARPPGRFIWTDLWTDDAAAARNFYGAVIGYQARSHEVGRRHRFEILGRDGRARAGLVVVDLEGIDSSWLPYVRVADVAGTVRQARSQGATVLLERPDLAVLIDPTGAAVGVQRWDGGSGS